MLIVYYIYKPANTIRKYYPAREGYTREQMEQLVESYNARSTLYRAALTEFEDGSLEMHLYQQLERVCERLQELLWEFSEK